MYKVCSIFSQVLRLFSRGDFEKAVKEHKAERHARGFTSWGQFMAMLFCQLGRAHSLRVSAGIKEQHFRRFCSREKMTPLAGTR